eukprot:s8720_g2.t1
MFRRGTMISATAPIAHSPFFFIAALFPPMFEHPAANEGSSAFLFLLALLSHNILGGAMFMDDMGDDVQEEETSFMQRRPETTSALEAAHRADSASETERKTGASTYLFRQLRFWAGAVILSGEASNTLVLVAELEPAALGSSGTCSVASPT